MSVWTVRDWKINWKFVFFDKRLSCAAHLWADCRFCCFPRAVAAHLQSQSEYTTHSTHTVCALKAHNAKQSRINVELDASVCVCISVSKAPTRVDPTKTTNQFQTDSTKETNMDKQITSVVFVCLRTPAFVSAIVYFYWKEYFNDLHTYDIHMLLSLDAACNGPTQWAMSIAQKIFYYPPPHPQPQKSTKANERQSRKERSSLAKEK